MSAPSTTDQVFPPRKANPAKDQWTHTNSAAREIIRRETADRDAKTEKLRKSRLAREAEEVAQERSAPKRKQKRR